MPSRGARIRFGDEARVSVSYELENAAGVRAGHDRLAGLKSLQRHVAVGVFFVRNISAGQARAKESRFSCSLIQLRA